jgi:hypothetical protein
MRILDTYNLRIHIDNGCIVSQLRTKGAVCSMSEPMTRLEMLDFADKLQESAVALREHLALEDPAEAFKLAQAMQFGTDRLEGDL